MKTLKVQGKGEASVAPDKCIFSMVVSEKHEDYTTCHFDLNSKVERLRVEGHGNFPL